MAFGRVKRDGISHGGGGRCQRESARAAVLEQLVRLGMLLHRTPQIPHFVHNMADVARKLPNHALERMLALDERSQPTCSPTHTDDTARSRVPRRHATHSVCFIHDEYGL